MIRRWLMCVGMLLAVVWASGCGSKEIEVEADPSEMTPEQQALFDEMRRAEQERDRVLQTPPPQPGSFGVQPPTTPSYGR